MKNKFYLIQYSSNDEWEISKGVCLVGADSRKNAIKNFGEKIKNRKIKEINLISSKSGLIFNQDVSIL